MKIWYLELKINNDLDDKIKQLVERTGVDDEEIVVKALEEFVENKVGT